MFKDLWIKIKKWLARGTVAAQDSSTSEKNAFEASNSYGFAVLAAGILLVVAFFGAFVVATKFASLVGSTLGGGFFVGILMIVAWFSALALCFDCLGHLMGFIAKATMAGIEENYDELVTEFGKQAVDDALMGVDKNKWDSKPEAKEGQEAEAPSAT